VVICLEQGADLHLAQLMPLPLTVSCFSKIQIGSTFLVPAHLSSRGKRAVKRMCVCVCYVNSSSTPVSISLLPCPFCLVSHCNMVQMSSIECHHIKLWCLNLAKPHGICLLHSHWCTILEHSVQCSCV